MPSVWATAKALLRVGFVGSLVLVGPRLGVAEDRLDPPVIEEDTAPEISRDAWQARIQQARQRAKEVAIERRLHPERFTPPPPEDPDILATERVLRDESLQRGDIVATKKGLFVFRGRSDQPRSEADFIALPAR